MGKYDDNDAMIFMKRMPGGRTEQHTHVPTYFTHLSYPTYTNMDLSIPLQFPPHP
jgi:hypothetical protein